MKLANKSGAALLVALLTATSASMSFAAGGDRAGMRFEGLDTNGDGFVTESEFSAAQTARFNENDTNGDGALNVEEMTAMAQARMKREVKSDRIAGRIQKTIADADTNGDGVLQFDELPKPDFSELLSKADADGDGQLTEAEMATLKGMRGGFGQKG